MNEGSIYIGANEGIVVDVSDDYNERNIMMRMKELFNSVFGYGSPNKESWNKVPEAR